jgi:hypothetical protein
MFHLYLRDSVQSLSVQCSSTCADTIAAATMCDQIIGINTRLGQWHCLVDGGLLVAVSVGLASLELQL